MPINRLEMNVSSLFFDLLGYYSNFLTARMTREKIDYLCIGIDSMKLEMGMLLLLSDATVQWQWEFNINFLLVFSLILPPAAAAKGSSSYFY